MEYILSASFIGFLWLGVLFAVCFACVHIAKLARLGYLYNRKKTQEKPSEKSAEKPTEPQKKPPSAESEKEPVYYIVERKRRVKTGYSTPKEIKFR